MAQARILVTVFALLVMLSASSTDAAARGTHFILEGQVAGLLTDTTELGMANSLVLGFGGKLRRVPIIRLYVTGQVGYDLYDTRRTRVAADALTRQGDLIYAFGPRLYLAFNQRARLLFDVMLGGYWGRSEWTLNNIETYEAEDHGLAFIAGIGFQYRLLRNLSLGLRLDRCEFSGRINRRNLAAFLGFPENRSEALLPRTRLGLTITAHF